MDSLRPRRLLVLLAAACVVVPGAATWKLVLKDGTTIVCDAPPIVVQGSCLFRGIDGKDGSVAADRIDQEPTGRANRVDPKPRWREIERLVQQKPQASEAPARESGSVLALGDSNFDAEVLHSRVPVLVDFSATWCGPCRKLAPTIDAVANQYAGKVTVGRLDVDRSPATADRYGVRTYPTLLLFQNGAAVARVVGAVGRDEVARLLDAHL
jgi:thioredoxin 1